MTLNRLFFGPAMVLGLYMVCVTGAGAGAGLGYEAATADQASMEYNGTHLIVGENATNVEIDWVEEEPREELHDYPGSEFVEEDLDRFNNELSQLPGMGIAEIGVQKFTESTMDLGFTLAATAGDATASFVYANRGWLPVSVVNGVLTIAGILPIGAAVVMAWSRVQRLRREID